MTLERASEIVYNLRLGIETREMAQDMFYHFVDYFDLKGHQIKQFAVLCGYAVAIQLGLSDE